jgi:galactokinase
MMALSPKEDDYLQLYSLDFNQSLEGNISEFFPLKSSWKEYIKGIARILTDLELNIKGFEGVFAGDLPIGAGLSSSAALEVAAVKAFCLTSNLPLLPLELAKVGLKAEREWIGLNVGIMDQLISATGKRGFALKLDCRTTQGEYVPIPDNFFFVVMDTRTRRELSHSAYNTRHDEVLKAAELLGVPYLRDATLSLLNKQSDRLSPTLHQRARHVITENQRVHAFESAMKNKDLQEMGRLINESHRSLRDNFDVSSTELNTIVEIAQAQAGCFGARLTGAGFGGCALAMVENNRLDDFTRNVHRLYQTKTGIEPHIFKVESSDGVHTIDIRDI